ncbi:Centrin-1 [Tetrabaena socialis]|uniref:Centrin-1 n=1 Tax=Tetrabaena socialis TaxID=47790 RepID=A0A2J8AGX2_9CHLO|nr:Centrin-1 [Tetrabaena socialis]|eukprot:PNH11764.1 Centrin-1 [Tetrabaena socialis]
MEQPTDPKSWEEECLGARPALAGSPVDHYVRGTKRFSKAGAGAGAAVLEGTPAGRELTFRIAYAQAKTWSLTHKRQLSPIPLPEAIERRIRQWFELVDDDGSGQLDAAELEFALKASGIPASASAILEIIKLFDFDKDGEIAWREFHHFLCYEVMADKDPLGAEYVLPSGLALPIGSMIGAIRRRKLLSDVERPGSSRDGGSAAFA